MSEWTETYANRIEQGTHIQGNKLEFKVPNGFDLFYLHDAQNPTKFNEPELDLKDSTKHSEVYDGRFTSVVYFTFSNGCMWLVTNPIHVQAGRTFRGIAWAMFVRLGTGVGARLGICDGDGQFGGSFARHPDDRGLMSDSMVWGPWVSSYDGAEDRIWYPLTTPDTIPLNGHIRLVLEFASNVAGHAAGHFDSFLVEQLVGSGDGSADVDYALFRQIVREELDKTRWESAPSF